MRTKSYTDLLINDKSCNYSYKVVTTSREDTRAGGGSEASNRGGGKPQNYPKHKKDTYCEAGGARKVAKCAGLRDREGWCWQGV